MIPIPVLLVLIIVSIVGGIALLNFLVQAALSLVLLAVWYYLLRPNREKIHNYFRSHAEKIMDHVEKIVGKGSTEITKGGEQGKVNQDEPEKSKA
ncbi:MAG: ferritin-like domain-containing protein [candidate division KSB1 bacterium]|nr:ferritin-like domain-containing protein [candidate division KSB1 bacterium]